MQDTADQRKRRAAIERARRSKARARAGIRLVTVTLGDDEVDGLIQRGLIDDFAACEKAALQEVVQDFLRRALHTTTDAE